VSIGSSVVSMVSRAAERADGALVNLLTGLGTSSDPRKATRIVAPKALTPDEADALVRAHWAARKYVEELPGEALRKWIDLSVEGGPEDAAKRILDKMEELEVRQKLQRALTWERQYGAAVLLLGVSDSEDAREPLDLRSGAPLRFVEPYSRKRVLDPTTSDLITDPNSPRFGLPEYYRIRTHVVGAAIEVHYSRVLVFPGWRPEDDEQPYRFGCTALDSFWPAMRDYESSMGYGLGIGARLTETRMKIKGLTEMLTGNATLRDKARAMLEEIHTARSVFHMLPFDGDDEVADAQLSFSGYAELIRIARENLAAASGLSLQRFFGLTREGLSDKDEGASERDDAAVAQYQRDRLLGPLNRLVAVVASSLGLYAPAPEGEREDAAETSSGKIKTWQIMFIPLREETPSQRSERQLKEAQTDQIYRDTGAVHEDEIRESLRAREDNRYQLEDGAMAESFGPTDEDAALLEPQGESALPEGADVGLGDGIQATVLNGAQVTSMIEVVRAAVGGEIPRESAIAILQAAFGLTPDVASQVLGPEGFEPKKEEPPPVALPRPGAQPPPPTPARE
jgi:uncharacterized protein